MRIILCVTNDIATDRRVNRIALSLMKLFSDVWVIGRIQSGSIDLPIYPYHARRFNMLFSKGPFFYAEYNIRLFFLLLFIKADILVANDLDTLPAVFLVSRLRKMPVVYDSHEYFTEVPELIGRKCVKRIWERVEALILPHLKYSYTVSASVAVEYNRKYGISMQVIRNLPFRIENFQLPFSLKKNNESLIIYQGSLNMGRGLETMIRAMQHIENAVLYIVGKGDIENRLKELMRSLALDKKICFTGLIPASELSFYTLQADLGISLEEKLGLNYYYALPNKLFDYIQARIPVLVADLPEMKAVVQHYRIGKVISTDDPYELSLIITEMLADHVQQQIWKSNLEAASRELCWENEEGVLLGLFNDVITGVQAIGKQ